MPLCAAAGHARWGLEESLAAMWDEIPLFSISETFQKASQPRYCYNMKRRPLFGKAGPQVPRPSWMRGRPNTASAGEP